MEGAPSRCQFSWKCVLEDGTRGVIGCDSKEWVFALSGWGEAGAVGSGNRRHGGVG